MARRLYVCYNINKQKPSTRQSPCNAAYHVKPIIRLLKRIATGLKRHTERVLQCQSKLGKKERIDKQKYSSAKKRDAAVATCTHTAAYGPHTPKGVKWHCKTDVVDHLTRHREQNTGTEAQMVSVGEVQTQRRRRPCTNISSRSFSISHIGPNQSSHSAKWHVFAMSSRCSSDPMSGGRSPASLRALASISGPDLSQRNLYLSKRPHSLSSRSSKLDGRHPMSQWSGSSAQATPTLAFLSMQACNMPASPARET